MVPDGARRGQAAALIYPIHREHRPPFLPLLDINRLEILLYTYHDRIHNSQSSWPSTTRRLRPSDTTRSPSTPPPMARPSTTLWVSCSPRIRPFRGPHADSSQVGNARASRDPCCSRTSTSSTCSPTLTVSSSEIAGQVPHLTHSPPQASASPSASSTPREPALTEPSRSPTTSRT